MKDIEKEAKKLARNIKNTMQGQGISIYALAKITNINSSTISQFLSGKIFRVEWYTLYKIAVALNTTIDSLIQGTQVEIIDNPEHREILKSMPPEAKLFFRSTKRIPKENVKIILDLIKLSIKEIHGPPKKIKKGKK